MKNSKIILGLMGVLLSITSHAGTEIVGWDQKTIDRVLDGQVVFVNKVDTDLEVQKVARLFVNKISTDAYLDLTVNYPKYPTIFEEVADVQLKEANKNLGQFRYLMDFVIYMGGLVPVTLHPEGRHTVKRAKTPADEATVTHEILNYKDRLELMIQKVRLIPYKSGILVEDDVHIAAKDSIFAKKVKSKFEEFFGKYPLTFRHALTGE